MAQPDIFLSYNREDASVAKLFAEAFAREGLEVWWDQALRSGEAYDQVTEEALESAKAVVVLWSPRSVVSRWVRAEATVAERNHTLMPVTIEPCKRPVMFELTQTADLSGWEGDPGDPAWRDFLADVQRMVGKEAPKAEVPEPAVNPVAAAQGAGVPQAGVLPFAIRGDDTELGFLAEDLTEDVTHALSENDYFKVIASGTMAAWRGQSHDYKAIGQQLDARYLVEGRLLRTGDTVRLAVQLIDTDTANTVWSHRFTESADEIAANPDNFPRIVASELAEQVMQAETKRAMTRPAPYTGWEHLMRSEALDSVADVYSGRDVFEELHAAIAVAPDFALAHARMAAALWSLNIVRGMNVDDETRREARYHVTRALQLDGQNSAVLCYLVTGSMALGDDDTCLRLAKRAVELRPNSPACHFALGAANMFLGRIGETIEVWTEQLRCIGFNAFNQGRFATYCNLGWCQLIEGNPNEAMQLLEQSLSLSPSFGNTHMFKAIAEAWLDKEEAALATVRRLKDIFPDLTVDRHLVVLNANPRLKELSAKMIETFHRLWDAVEGEG